MRLLIILTSLCCACHARKATEKYPFTPMAAEELVVNCTTDDTCGHGWCRNKACLCDYNYATQRVEHPCGYTRYSKTTALLLQIFLGAFGVGIAVLGWKVAIGMYWGFLLSFCCTGSMSVVYMDDDEKVGRGLCAMFLSTLSILGALATYITGIVFIAGSECMDINGFACGP